MPTKISWCDETWNPITGCSPPPYQRAARIAMQNGKHSDLRDGLGIRRKIFVCSMADIFHEDVFAHNCFDYGIHTEGNSAVLLEIFETTRDIKQHVFIILTKRPENARRFFNTHFGGDGYPPTCREIPENLWLGVTAENQKTADERIPILLDIPAAVRFVSVEPMLEKIDLGAAIFPRLSTPDWVICGGETGPKARYMNPEWVMNLYKQCKDADIPLFFKQWGSHKNNMQYGKIPEDIFLEIDECKEFPT